MLKGIAAGIAVSVLLIVGCSDSESDSNNFSCDSAQSKCPNDGPPDREQCKQILADPSCGTSYLKFLICAAEHQVCLADGTTDTEGSARQCAAQRQEAEQCAGVDAGGGG